MRSGKRYQIFMAPSAHRRYKKFDPPLQQKTKQEALRLVEDPYRYEELKGLLRGIRSYHFEYKKVQYRIAYRIRENKNQIEIVLVKSREGFYQTLRKIIG
ncbi:type II toxin-antitoxin system mRNA interferase toxin, RelE/StbE family [Candidatus Aerophobetes bacterium]|nr:type II toxin-antitoxin system mRNA interferase toxin, RelE/StbE family [Candidatus Aerophobetes bacterium]